MAAIIGLAAGDLSLRLTGRGGAILDFRRAGLPLLRPAPDDAGPGDSACFPLVPLGNRIRANRFVHAGIGYAVTPNAPPEPLHLHGAGWRADWQVAEAGAASARLVHRYEGPDLPHRYRAEQRFVLTAAALRITLSVTNTGPAALPFGLGWHPFLPDGARLTAPARACLGEGPGHLPTPAGPVPADLDFRRPRPLPPRWINNGFTGWDGRARIDWPERGLSLGIAADPLFAVYQLYRPAAGGFFAFEPMSHQPDALSRPDLGGLIPLSPGETLAGGITLTPGASGSSPGDPS